MDFSAAVKGIFYFMKITKKWTKQETNLTLSSTHS